MVPGLLALGACYLIRDHADNSDVCRNVMQSMALNQWRVLRITAAAVAVVSLTACGGQTGTVTSPPTPMAPQRETLNVGALERAYYVVSPPGAKGRLPLVVALHAVDETPLQFEEETRLDYEGAAAGFVIAYPEGIGGSWNAGLPGATEDADDVTFISEMIDALVRTGTVNPTRVYVAGMSNGGSMTYRLACELSDRIAAAASVSGSMVVETCDPGRPVSILEIHGTSDSIFPFEGYTAGGLTFPPSMSTMERWAQIDGCVGAPTVSNIAKGQSTSWTDCRNGTSVVLDAVRGGHLWFSPDTGGPDATRIVWEFFSHVPARS